MAEVVTVKEKQAWATVAMMFLTLCFIGGIINANGVFILPLIKQFGWSRAQVSLLTSAASFAAAGMVPIAGWLIDKIQARLVVTSGVFLAGCGWLVASQANSFTVILLGYAIFGLGLGCAGVGVCAAVVASWFDRRLGLALGLTMSGTALGGMLLTLIAQATITHAGWRTAYLVLAVMPIVIVIPPVWLIIRNRPSPIAVASAHSSSNLSGYEVTEALRTGSFWLISLARFTSAVAIGGLATHMVPSLVAAGYTSDHAALVQSLLLGEAALAKPLFGIIADRINGRRALTIDLFMIAAGAMLLTAIGDPRRLPLFFLTFGLAAGAPLSLIPTAMTEAVGRKRLGSILGLEGIVGAGGIGLGPIVAGWIFDLRGSYILAFELFAAILIIGGSAALLSKPFAEKPALTEPTSPTASELLTLE